MGHTILPKNHTIQYFYHLKLFRQESPEVNEAFQGRIWIPQDVWNNGYPDVGTPEKVIMKKESKFHPERHFWIRCTNGAEYHWKTVRADPGSENFDLNTGDMWIQPSMGIDSDGGSKKKRTRKRKKRKRRKKKRTKKHRK